MWVNGCYQTSPLPSSSNPSLVSSNLDERVGHLEIRIYSHLVHFYLNWDVKMLFLFCFCLFFFTFRCLSYFKLLGFKLHPHLKWFKVSCRPEATGCKYHSAAKGKITADNVKGAISWQASETATNEESYWMTYDLVLSTLECLLWQIKTAVVSLEITGNLHDSRLAFEASHVIELEHFYLLNSGFPWTLGLILNAN